MAAQSAPEQPPKEHRETGATKRSDYADPDNWKYPVHRVENVRAAISYFSQPDNYNVYSKGQQRDIWKRILRAAGKFEVSVDPNSGPPSVSAKSSLAEAAASGRAVVMSGLDGLPPKPADTDGRHVAWLWVTGEPGFFALDCRTEEEIVQVVDDEFIQRQIEAFTVLTERGYSPPLAVMHPDSIADTYELRELVEAAEGERGGDILELTSWLDEEGKNNLIAAVAFNDREAEAKLGREIKFFSPAFGSILMDTGEELQFVLKELSKVVAPHQKGRSTHVLASEHPVEGHMSAEESSVTLDERVGALEQGLVTLNEGQVSTQTALADISAKIAQLAYPPVSKEEEEEEEVEMSEKPAPAVAEPVDPAVAQMGELQAQLSEQKATISSLTDALTRQAFMGSFPKGATIELTEKNAEVFYQLSRRDPEGFKTLKATTKKPAQPSTPVIPLFGHDGGVTAFEVELGQPGEEPEVADTDASSVYASALEEAGSDANQALEIFKKKMGYA